MQQPPNQISMSRGSLMALLAITLLCGAALAYFITGGKQSGTQQMVETVPVQPELPAEPKPDITANKKPLQDQQVLSQQAKAPAVAKKSPAKKQKPAPVTSDFVIQGYLSTAGEPWSSRMILVKILWLKNKNQQQFLLGEETAQVQQTEGGFAYRIRLRPQTAAYLNWNGGVEGNVGRIIAFLDHKKDGKLSEDGDQIIAVSRELIRYRTGRYDKSKLSDAQQTSLIKAGKGYALMRNVQLDSGETDWQMVASSSPARLDLSAAETSLPGMYNTFLKMQK